MEAVAKLRNCPLSARKMRGCSQYPEVHKQGSCRMAREARAVRGHQLGE